MPRCALGPQGVRLIDKLAEQSNDQDRIEREQREWQEQHEQRRRELQERIEEASKRPTPGTSNLLDMREVFCSPVYWNGCYDLTGELGLLPIHLLHGDWRG